MFDTQPTRPDSPPSWGLLGPEQLASTRRTRTLGIAASIRRLNELAVPGIGNLWYAKQLVLPVLGLVVAESARQAGSKASNTEVTNAIEALACCIAYRHNGWVRDDRLRGRTKLQHRMGDRSADATWQTFRKKGFYVSQPMRMAAVQAVSDLGLVNPGTQRFNAHQVSEQGRHLVSLAVDEGVLKWLTQWVRGQKDIPLRSAAPGQALASLQEALSPLEPLPDAARSQLQSWLECGTANERDSRRSAIWLWLVGDPQGRRDLDHRPTFFDADHWDDLRTGQRFFRLRDQALEVLDEIEAALGPEAKRLTLTQAAARVAPSLERLNDLAQQTRDATGRLDDLAEARSFVQDCTAPDRTERLRRLIARDGQILRCVGDVIRPAGPAFEGQGKPQGQDEDDADTPDVAGDLVLPSNLSHRVRNLFLMQMDLRGELDTWLRPDSGADDAR
jgi:hypothetical protein